MISIAIASNFFRIILVSLPGHSGITRNSQAKELASWGRLTPISFDWKLVGAPFSSCFLALDL